VTEEIIQPVSGEVFQAIHGSADHPLRIGDLEIPCYVLEDERRVLAQGGMIASLGMSWGSGGKPGPDRLAKFTSGKGLNPFISAELSDQTVNPIKFRAPNGKMAYGYEATVLADVCEAVLRARDEGKLQKQQEHIAKRCEILVRGFARVGIIALVDEATGYQEVRARRALEKILEKFISDELLKWAKMFPDEFYQQLARLRGLHYSEIATKRPAYIGHLTNDIVYERLAPGVLKELKDITPKDDKGRRKHRYHQRLTEDIGNPRLREHLWAVIALMRASSNWRNFYSLLNRAFPKWKDHPRLFIEYEEHEIS
jgi:hypothetical protein